MRLKTDFRFWCSVRHGCTTFRGNAIHGVVSDMAYSIRLRRCCPYSMLRGGQWCSGGLRAGDMPGEQGRHQALAMAGAERQVSWSASQALSMAAGR